jgi:hypothetical protein
MVGLWRRKTKKRRAARVTGTIRFLAYSCGMRKAVNQRTSTLPRRENQMHRVGRGSSSLSIDGSDRNMKERNII